MPEKSENKQTVVLHEILTTLKDILQQLKYLSADIEGIRNQKKSN